MSSIVNLLYIYDPWLFHSFRMAFFVGFLCSICLIFKFYKNKIRKISIPKDSIVAIMCLLLLSIIPLIINRTMETGVLAMYVKLSILFLFGIAIYHLFYSKENGKTLLIRDLKIGIWIQFLIGLLSILGVSFIIDFALSVNSSVLFPRFLHSEQEYRLYNLTSSAFIQLSTFYVFLLHFLLAYDKKHNNLSGWIIFALLCIGLVSGRTFLVLSAISLIIYFKIRYIPYITLFIFLLFFLIVAFPDNWYVQHALEPLINLIHGGKSVSSSTDTLIKQHLFMPSIKQLIMGDGLYYTPTKGYYGGSDSGFVRQVLYGGIIYLIICFLFTVFFVIKIARAWFNNSLVFILSTLLLFTIIHIKFDTYAYPGIMFILLMFLSLFDRETQYIEFNRKSDN